MRLTAMDAPINMASPKAVILGLTRINIPRMIPNSNPSPRVVMDIQNRSERLECKEFNRRNISALKALTKKDAIISPRSSSKLTETGRLCFAIRPVAGYFFKRESI
jgi:hypothetical protein